MERIERRALASSRIHPLLRVIRVILRPITFLKRFFEKEEAKERAEISDEEINTLLSVNLSERTYIDIVVLGQECTNGPKTLVKYMLGLLAIDVEAKANGHQRLALIDERDGTVIKVFHHYDEWDEES